MKFTVNHLLKMSLTFILTLSTTLSAFTPASASETSDNTLLFQQYGNDPAMFDAAIYARLNNVSVKEGLRRLNLQQVVGNLSSMLQEGEKGSFGGLWIEHTPTFRVVALFTTNGNQTIQPYLSAELQGIVEVRNAETSWAELRAIRENTIKTIESFGLPTNSDINICENRIKVYVVDRALLDSVVKNNHIELSPRVDVITVKSLFTQETDVYGGLDGDFATVGATTGFGVEWPNGARGVTTAGHAPNTDMTVSGVAMQYWTEATGSYYDIQVHYNSGVTVTNEVQWWTDGSKRSITGTVSRVNQAIGQYVKKYGRTTKFTAGYISSIDFDPGVGDEATFIRVNNTAGYGNLSEPGDSGAPWFVTDNNNTYAYGSHKGSPGDDANDSIYMAINYISGIGVTVLTAP